ncbi:hypothetical protein DE169_003868 [Clostridium acetobutylicum]|nr:hypothetical protein [Clostridium acetobutylicum]
MFVISAGALFASAVADELFSCRFYLYRLRNV